jgi:predicted nucleic acid-binding protein
MESSGEGRLIVVDASVVVKWFVLGEGREEAIRLRDDYLEGKIKLVSPPIMAAEVLNAVRYCLNSLKPETLREIATSLELYGIKQYALDGDYVKLLVEASMDNDITIYDATYVALAKYLNTTLYTAEDELMHMLSDEYKRYVKHISSYPPTKKQ